MTSVTSTTQAHTQPENDNLEILHIHRIGPTDIWTEISQRYMLFQPCIKLKNHKIKVRRLKKNKLNLQCQNKLLQACTWTIAEEVLRRPHDKFPLHNIQTW